MDPLRWNYAPKPPTHHTGVVTAVHDNNRADVLMFVEHGPLDFPKVPTMPGLELGRGYRVVVTAFRLDCCVTAVIGFMPDEHIDAIQRQRADERRKEDEARKARESAEKAEAEAAEKRSNLVRAHVQIQDALELAREASDGIVASGRWSFDDAQVPWQMVEAVANLEQMEELAASWTAEETS